MEKVVNWAWAALTFSASLRRDVNVQNDILHQRKNSNLY